MKQDSNQIFEKMRLLEDSDLLALRKFVCTRIAQVTNQQILELEDYHVTHAEHHELLKNKSARELNASDVSEILTLPSIVRLTSRFHRFKVDCVIDENGVQNRPEIYFRVVRPNFLEDVGTPHMDWWYHSAAGLEHTKGTTFKVWISLCSEPGLSGLKFFPNADVSKIKWVKVGKGVSCDPNQPGLGTSYLPQVSPGEGLIFCDDVLHQGALNLGRKTRVSIEITFVPKTL
jgi:hypothetical protein